MASKTKAAFFMVISMAWWAVARWNPLARESRMETPAPTGKESPQGFGRRPSPKRRGEVPGNLGSLHSSRSRAVAAAPDLLPFFPCAIAREPPVNTGRTQGSRRALPFNSRRANPRSYAHALRRDSLASGRRTAWCFETGDRPARWPQWRLRCSPPVGHEAPQWSKKADDNRQHRETADR